MKRKDWFTLAAIAAGTIVLFLVFLALEAAFGLGTFGKLIATAQAGSESTRSDDFVDLATEHRRIEEMIVWPVILLLAGIVDASLRKRGSALWVGSLALPAILISSSFLLSFFYLLIVVSATLAVRRIRRRFPLET